MASHETEAMWSLWEQTTEVDEEHNAMESLFDDVLDFQDLLAFDDEQDSEILMPTFKCEDGCDVDSGCKWEGEGEYEEERGKEDLTTTDGTFIQVVPMPPTCLSSDSHKKKTKNSKASVKTKRSTKTSKLSMTMNQTSFPEQLKLESNQIDLTDSHFSPLQVVGTFEEDVFVERYQRNNKCSGLKNLRCFPNCGQAHNSRKFCGQPITFRTVHSLDVDCDVDIDSLGVSRIKLTHCSRPCKDLVAWGRFDKAEKGDKSVILGSIVPRHDILQQERRRGQPFLPWYPSVVKNKTMHGTSAGKEIVEFQFNSEQQGWHYGWQATKYTCNEEHVFKVYVFTPVGASHLLCVGIFDSPRFSIYCRRRRRFDRPDADDLVSPTTLESRLLWYTLSHLEKVRHEDTLSDTDSEGCNSSLPGSPMASEQERKENKLQLVLDAFAKHIVEETVFTERIKTISKQVSYRRDRGESIDSGFRLFLKEIRDYIQVFFIKHGITLDDFQSLEGFVSLKRESPVCGPTVTLGSNDTSAMKKAKTKKRTRDDRDLPLSWPSVSLPKSEQEPEEEHLDIAQDDLLRTTLNSKPERAVRCAFIELVDTESAAAKTIKRPRRAECKVIETLHSKRVDFEDDASKENDLDITKYLAFSAANSNNSASTLESVWRSDGFQMEATTTDVSGEWIREQTTYAKISEFRQTCGMPWVRRKLLEMMESRVKFEETPTSINCFLSPKLLSDGFIEYPLDGRLHPFNFKDPIFGISRPMALTKQAFVVGNAVVIRHTYSEHKRMTRIFWRPQGKDELRGRAFYEERAPKCAWNPMVEFVFLAYKA